MIILKHLTVERFRLLREIDLHFPQRGSILIQGPNEAGKSTLFESIYFALYGESLTSKRKKRTQDEHERYDDLILYGENEAHVTLILTIGPSELIINRSIKRGIGQEVSLSVRRLGVHEERITSLDAANERILSEIGHIDRTILRNSCLIEQKALNRVEQLSGREDLLEVDKQEAEIAEQELALEHLQHKREQLKSLQNRIQQLRKAQNILSEIINAYETIARTQRELPDLERQLSEIERHEVEELPALEQLVQELSDLTKSFSTLERMAADLLAAVNSIKGLEQELKQHQHIQAQLAEIDDQIIKTRLLVDEVQQSQQELEAQFRTARPQLEARLQRLQALSDRFSALEEMEKMRANTLEDRAPAEENSVELAKVNAELQEAEQKLALV